MIFIGIIKPILLESVEGITNWLHKSAVDRAWILVENFSIGWHCRHFKEMVFVVDSTWAYFAVVLLFFHKLTLFFS